MRDARMGRRGFLGGGATGGGGLFPGGGAAGGGGLFAGSRLSRAAAPIGSVVPNALHSLVPDGWRIYSVNPPWPAFDPATYRLTVAGAVENQLSLTWDEVMQLPQDSQVTDFHCVTGWTVGNVHWTGVRLQHL